MLFTWQVLVSQEWNGTSGVFISKVTVVCLELSVSAYI